MVSAEETFGDSGGLRTAPEFVTQIQLVLSSNANFDVKIVEMWLHFHVESERFPENVTGFQGCPAFEKLDVDITRKELGSVKLKWNYKECFIPSVSL